jgi:hypothetical protein
MLMPPPDAPPPGGGIAVDPALAQAATKTAETAIATSFLAIAIDFITRVVLIIVGSLVNAW